MQENVMYCYTSKPFIIYEVNIKNKEVTLLARYGDYLNYVEALNKAEELTASNGKSYLVVELHSTTEPNENPVKTTHLT